MWRLVIVSIIGINAFAGGYNAAKVAQEQAAVQARSRRASCARPSSTSSWKSFMRWGTQGDVSYVWKIRTQLVAARTVAEALVELAAAPDPEFDAAKTTEVAGPRAEWFAEAARLLAARRGEGLRVEEAPVDPSDPDSERYATGAACSDPTPSSPARPSRSGWTRRCPPAGFERRPSR